MAQGLRALGHEVHAPSLSGHSYGGMVITGAADRQSGRVGHRVYLGAACPCDGESLHDHAFAMIDQARQTMRQVGGSEAVLEPAPGFAAFFGVIDPVLGA